MKYNLSIKRKCSVCKIKVKNNKDHLEKNHKELYIEKRIKLLGKIEKVFKLIPYIVFIIITLLYFFFDLLTDIIIWTIIIPFIIVLYKKRKSIIKESVIYFFDKYENLKKEVSEKAKKTKATEVKPTIDEAIEKLFSVLNSSYAEEFNINWIKDIFKDEKYKGLSLIKGLEDKFMKNLSIVFEKLNKFQDKEEFELNKFLKSKGEHHYTFWILLQIIVILSAIIFSILTNIIEGGFYLFYILLLIMIIFNDIQNRMNKTFNKGYYRFVKNKKFLKEFENFLRLIFYNSHFRKTEEYNNLNKLYILLKERADNYGELISPYMDYLKRFEFIAILGLIISYFYPLFQPSIMISFLYNHWLDLIVALILILGVFIHPYITRRKDETIIKVQSELREDLEKLIKEVNFCILIYNLEL